VPSVTKAAAVARLLQHCVEGGAWPIESHGFSGCRRKGVGSLVAMREHRQRWHRSNVEVGRKDLAPRNRTRRRVP
jgi:hypothetical protein